MNMEKQKAFIFDLDGVLVSTDKYHYHAWKCIADILKIPFDEKVNSRLRGVSRMDSLEILLSLTDKKLTIAEKEALADYKNRLYRERISEMTSADVSENTRKILKACKSSGYKLAIGSSSKNAGYILKQVKLEEYFDAVIDGNNITKSKPDPEVFLMAAERLRVKPEVCYVVEDAASGIQAAKSAGMIAIGINASCVGADILITDIEEISQLIFREAIK